MEDDQLLRKVGFGSLFGLVAGFAVNVSLVFAEGSPAFFLILPVLPVAFAFMGGWVTAAFVDGAPRPAAGSETAR